jgi:hypothetical protein
MTCGKKHIVVAAVLAVGLYVGLSLAGALIVASVFQALQ